MKQALFLLLLFSSLLTRGQSLKEALFSGKLKNEPGTVIRKGDDLSTKMDTAAKKVPARDTIAVFTVVNTGDSAQKQPAATTAPAKVAATADVNTSADSAATESTAEASAEDKEKADTAATAEVAPPAPKPKDNNALWKEYINNLVPTLKSEVLSSKKVKKGSYYVLVSYAIGTDGQTTITDVFVSPENDFLQQQIRDRINLEAPKLAPVLNSAGNPRKVNKKYNFTIDKE